MKIYIVELGAVQKEKLFQVELNQNVDLSKFLNKQKGHPKVENTTYWTAPIFIFLISFFLFNVIFLISYNRKYEISRPKNKVILAIICFV